MGFLLVGCGQENIEIEGQDIYQDSVDIVFQPEIVQGDSEIFFLQADVFANDSGQLCSRLDLQPITGKLQGEFGVVGELVNGYKIGWHKTWHDNGKEKSKVYYSNGNRNYPCSQRHWDKDGRLRLNMMCKGDFLIKRNEYRLPATEIRTHYFMQGDSVQIREITFENRKETGRKIWSIHRKQFPKFNDLGGRIN